MTLWLQDIRHAVRALRGNAGFTVAALLTMSVAIGATTGVFTVVNTVILRPLPFPDPGRIIAAGTTRRDAPSQLHTVSLEELHDWQQQAGNIATFAGWRDWGMLRYDGQQREGVYGVIATPELFQVFPAEPVLGRLLGPEDDRPGRNGVVLLSYSYWQQRFGGDRTVLGKPLVLERGPKATYTIIGVLPAAFQEIPSFDRVKVFAPSSIDPDAATGRATRNRAVFARLRGGVSLAAAQREMDVIAGRLASQYPATNGDRAIRLEPAVDYEVGPMADTLRTFLVAVSLVLLIACANVAGLQMVRALARRREFSIRRALGGSRGTIARAIVVESGLLALVAGVIGLVAAGWLVDVVLAAAPPISRAAAVQFDVRVFAFTVLVCLASGLLLALPATLLAMRFDVVQALKEQSAQVAGGTARQVRMAFVAAQVALALVLLTGAVAAGQTLVRQLTLKPGFEPKGVAATQIYPPIARYPKGEQISALYEQLLDAARSVPGVLAASAVSATPLSGEGREPAPFSIEGDAPAPGARPTVNAYNVAPGYFHTLDALMLRGRDFGPRDTAPAPQVAVVNDAFVQRYLEGRDPLRTRIRLGNDGPTEIIGIAADVLQDVNPRAISEPEIYVPYAQHPRWATFLVIRAEGDNAASAMAAVIKRIGAIDPEIRPGTAVLMTDRLQRTARGPRFVLLLFGGFAAVALLLSTIGVAGLVFYTSAQRAREIAVRISLGATRRDIRRLVGTGAFTAVILGSLAGLAGTFVTMRALGTALRDLVPLGPQAVLAVWIVLVALGWIACYLPARRALTIDPADALRLDGR